MSTEKERSMEIAKTILAQLGGNVFKTMTGARNFMSHTEDRALSFHLPSGTAKNQVNYVKIKLNEMDLYDIEFGRTWKRPKGAYVYDVKATVEGAYADMLQSVFTEYTGLYTSLGIRKAGQSCREAARGAYGIPCQHYSQQQ
jgi:hypothetical protein